MNLLPLPFFLMFMIGNMYGRKKNKLKIVAICQPMTTAMVLATAALSFVESYRTTYTVWIMIGLIVSIIADSMLVSRTDKTAFVKGMALFFVAIVVYGWTWTRLSGWHNQDYYITGVMIILYTMLAIVFMKYSKRSTTETSKILKFAVLVYMFTFCLVISRAFSTFNGDYFNHTQSILMTIGITLFFCGDMQLGIYHFIDKNFPMGQAPPFYFVGQLLIALSCSYF